MTRPSAAGEPTSSGSTNHETQGKVAIITGGSKGIGLGCARVFAKHGCRGGPGGTGARRRAWPRRQELTDDGPRSDVRADRRVETGRHAGADRRRVGAVRPARLHRQQRRLASAGHDHRADQRGGLRALLRLNLTSTFLGCKLAVPHLRKTRGSIINMSSEVALIGQAAAPAYVSTKAGQIGLTRALALDLAPDGIRVNAVCPAGVMTPLMRDGPTPNTIRRRR